MNIVTFYFSSRTITINTRYITSMDYVRGFDILGCALEINTTGASVTIDKTDGISEYVIKEIHQILISKMATPTTKYISHSKYEISNDNVTHIETITEQVL